MREKILKQIEDIKLQEQQLLAMANRAAGAIMALQALLEEPELSEQKSVQQAE